MTDSIDENFPTEGEGGVEDHSTHFSMTNSQIRDEHDSAIAQDLNFFANDAKTTGGKMLDGLASTGVWKRHQGAFAPARNYEHYLSKFNAGSPMSN